MKLRLRRRKLIAAMRWREWIAIKHPVFGRTHFKPIAPSPLAR